jgi:hypothetical protein
VAAPVTLTMCERDPSVTAWARLTAHCDQSGTYGHSGRSVGLSPASLPKRGSWFDLAKEIGVKRWCALAMIMRMAKYFLRSMRERSDNSAGAQLVRVP